MVTKEEISSWLRLFADPVKRGNLVLLGGEPTLHPDLSFAVKEAWRLGYETVTIDTNGFLHNDIIEKITPQEAVLSFSLDGPTPEVNDPIRGAGGFAICTKNIARAVAKGFEVSLIYTVSSMNLAHLERMPELLRDLGVRNFFVQIIGLRGHSAQGEGAGDLQLTPDEWLRTVPGVARRAADLGIHVIYPKVFLAEDEAFECAGRVAENYFIFPNGRVYQCPLCEDHAINAFNIEAGELVENPGLGERQFFTLDIPEGCVMNKLLQPGNIQYNPDGTPRYRISCCLLKQEISPYLLDRI